jgi:AbrB family looped-hinge helix DNA binding protein
MPESTHLSTKGQVVIPRRIRRRLRLEPGEELTVEVRGEEILLRRSPRSWTDWGYGLGRHVWQGIDVDAYLRRERKSWDRKLP